MSPVHDYLKTNATLTDYEAEAARKTIQSLKTKLLGIDRQVARLNEEIERLLWPRAELAQSLRDHETLFSPIRRLPPELLSDESPVTFPIRSIRSGSHFQRGSVTYLRSTLQYFPERVHASRRESRPTARHALSTDR
ncbi:hypothetical protein PLICRDRAFT_40879 [Plicaturopsis crispa FD-325 SS-3]|nr:hypothetical protein PLICRDRAFT_40879 [Plicaturopsis crispa FD-325 SS-3]